MSGDMQELKRPSTWREKVLAIHHLNRMLQNRLHDHDLEAVLMVIAVFANAETDPESASPRAGPPLAIEPLLAPPKEVQTACQSPVPSPHMKAAAVLVKQKGGLRALTVPGLPEVLA